MAWSIKWLNWWWHCVDALREIRFLPNTQANKEHKHYNNRRGCWRFYRQQRSPAAVDPGMLQLYSMVCVLTTWLPDAPKALVLRRVTQNGFPPPSKYFTSVRSPPFYKMVVQLDLAWTNAVLNFWNQYKQQFFHNKFIQNEKDYFIYVYYFKWCSFGKSLILWLQPSWFDFGWGHLLHVLPPSHCPLVSCHPSAVHYRVEAEMPEKLLEKCTENMSLLCESQWRIF